MGRLSLKAEDALLEKNLADEAEEVAKQFMHIYNLFLIYGQEKLDSYKQELREKGLPESYISQAEKRGALMSNWSRDKFVAERCESKGIVCARMSKA